MKAIINQQIILKQPLLRAVTTKIDAVDGLNLGQGICKTPTPALLVEAAQSAMAAGMNRYCHAAGLPALREAACNKLKNFNDIECEYEQVLVTQGSTGAFEAICQILINEGDEVISFEPFYPYHEKAITHRKAITRHVPLSFSDWTLDPKDIENLINERTKFIILTSPHNPTGKVFSKEELACIADICIKHDLLCVTDEVYEYMVYENNQHVSMASFPKMRNRTFTVGSYSKTFSITGWRVGYICAPREFIPALTSALDNTYICAPTPLQHAVASAMSELGGRFL